MTEWMDGHSTGTNDWCLESQLKKKLRTEAYTVVHPFSRRAPFRESCSTAQRLDAFPSVLEGQFKVETYRTQTKAVTVTSINQRQLDVWHVTLRTIVNATSTGSVAHQAELFHRPRSLEKCGLCYFNLTEFNRSRS